MDLCLKTIQDMAQMPLLRQMALYGKHGSCTNYHHSVYVALTAYRLKKFFHLNVNDIDLARGAMLHDFYLYDAKASDIPNWEHGKNHAGVALENAKEHFELTNIEEDIIFSHMWPLNITHLPHKKESILVNIADKYCAVMEYFNSVCRRENLSRKAFQLLEVAQ